jgi:hypothetical protein
VNCFEVLGIELLDLYELIRFNLNVKLERVGLISYRDADKYYLGFYYPSFLKKFPLAYIYVTLSSPPSKVYSYINDYEGGENIYPYAGVSPSSVNIPVGYIKSPPHKFASIEAVGGDYGLIEVGDLRSLMVVGSTAYFEFSDIPYIWYDVDRGIYLLNIYLSGDIDSTNLYFYCSGEYLGPYIYLDDKFDRVVSEGYVKNMSKVVFQVVRGSSIPYSMFIDKY